MGGCHRLHDREPEPGTRRCTDPLGQPPERLEQAGHGLLRDERAVVDDLDVRVPVWRDPGPDADPAVLGVVPYRVVDQIGDQSAS